MYYKFKVNEDKGFFEEAEKALNELIAFLEQENKSNDNIAMYKNELTKIKKRIESDHKKQDNYMKKMIITFHLFIWMLVLFLLMLSQ